MIYEDKKILVTGGTGSFGQRFISRIIEADPPRELVVFSRDELKQFEMREAFPVESTPGRYFLGDI